MVTTAAIAFTVCCGAQNLLMPRDTLIVAYSYAISDGDTIKCRRTLMPLFAYKGVYATLMDDNDIHDLHTAMQNVESFLQQRKSGYILDDAFFESNIRKVKELERHYALDLGLIDYQNEFSFYKKHPVKTQQERYEERKKWIRWRNDSIQLAEKKRQASEDSIDEVNYRIELQRGEDARKIHQKKEDNGRLEKEELRKRELVRRHQELIGKYGTHDGNLIFNKKVEIGWTKEKCLESWGKPREINRTTTANLRREQWVYAQKTYLYFEDGTLIAIQD